MTYAIRWSEDDGPERSGGLIVGDETILLTDGEVADDDGARRAIPCTDLADLYLERGSGSTRPLLVLLTHSGSRLRISTLEGLGALHELAELLTHVRTS